ncbi:MAG TPA: flavodoxin domain-containing protein [Leptolinea sp.]
MSEKILVTYATKYGSTQGVAEAITEELRAKGHTVDLTPARDVKSLDGYTAVVLGSPLYINSILGDASKFLAYHKDTLTQITTVFFVLGPLYNTPKDMTEVQAQLDSVLAKLPWFKPVDAKIFTGAMDLKKFRFPDSLLKMMPANKDNSLFKTYDGRDWEAIRAWADSLDGLFQQQSA